MIKRKILGTELEVSPLGLGTVKIGRNQGVKYPQSFEIPSDQEVIALLTLAQELGFNLLDTAPAYGESESRLGKLLKNNHDWVISTKVGEDFHEGVSTFDFSPQHITRSIERSLRNLRRDFLDIVFVHSNGDDLKIIDQGVFEVLSELKQKGLIKAYGMSTKTIEGGMKTIQQADVAMVTYNLTETQDQTIIQYAHQQNKNIFIKKAFASGHMNYHDSLNFILSQPGITSIIIGTINPEHLKHNVDCFIQIMANEQSWKSI